MDNQKTLKNSILTRLQSTHTEIPQSGTIRTSSGGRKTTRNGWICLAVGIESLLVAMALFTKSTVTILSKNTCLLHVSGSSWEGWRHILWLWMRMVCRGLRGLRGMMCLGGTSNHSNGSTWTSPKPPTSPQVAPTKYTHLPRPPPTPDAQSTSGGRGSGTRSRARAPLRFLWDLMGLCTRYKPTKKSINHSSRQSSWRWKNSVIRFGQNRRKIGPGLRQSILQKN